MSLKKSTEELKNLNENTLDELESKNRKIEDLEYELTKHENIMDDMEKDTLETLKKENSILASQLRELQEEREENSNISRIQNKNLGSLEATIEMLTERCDNLEKENRRLTSLLPKINENDNKQAQIHFKAVTKLKGKISKLKETLNQRNNQLFEFENEAFRLNQLIEEKDKEISNVLAQFQDFKLNSENELNQKDAAFLERIKSI